MKRQLINYKYGFTLVELMLVISLISVFFIAIAQFNWNPRNNSEKAELLGVSLAEQIRGEIQSLSIGKMPKFDGKVAQLTQINISTGGLATTYMSGATIIGSSLFQPPYFDGDAKYVIQSVVWTGSSNSGDRVNGGANLIIEPSGISFSGSNAGIKNNIFLEITVGYVNSIRKIILDRRTGKILELRY